MRSERILFLKLPTQSITLISHLGHSYEKNYRSDFIESKTHTKKILKYMNVFLYSQFLQKKSVKSQSVKWNSRTPFDLTEFFKGFFRQRIPRKKSGNAPCLVTRINFEFQTNAVVTASCWVCWFRNRISKLWFCEIIEQKECKIWKSTKLCGKPFFIRFYFTPIFNFQSYLESDLSGSERRPCVKNMTVCSNYGAW